MRRALTISLITMVPAWCLRVVLFHQFLVQDDDKTLRSFLPYPGEWLFLAIDLFLAGSFIFVLNRFGLSRSEYWWLAGGLFVVAAAAASAILEVPTAGDFVFFDFLFSMLSGYWLIIFAAGALAWRRWTPTYPPKSWTRPPQPGYDDE